ncbi:MAG: DUF3572 family protein [Sphingomonas sp.]|uniref:DUF3572 family protein n=1 Tax=Sphingomonas sp. TaxID=28214 RepID=UPI0018403B15|nr:DUF3572 family protein [Sphingomonas sp.]MBA3668089.1 DUF3572 family protein [Sphingomonas sp.]
MLTESTNDAEATALAALAATLTDERRARRFLDLTGLSPNELRARAGERSLLAATIAFLESHEPDLIAVAEEIGVKPAHLVAAGVALKA